ncbi:DUF3793 family protein [Caproiciproducens sp. NJN-50]|uniref:DUF3793 family protein n=1 Tax=Acutalibacteraceae TaxID=3082771 RepID=UPI000FFE17A7|nr:MULTISPECIES: DUF3793 family protein [Acutalibacteraceae]QAT50221.1 DUF3793 family protein [Caproiciproducens sp. NJN-50]
MEKSFEASLVEQCAPTLAGMKPANLFLYQSEDRESVYSDIARWDRELAPYAMSVCVVKECECESSYLVYVYRKAGLARVLSERMTCSFLRTLGYDTSRGCDALLRQLSGRLCLEREFPHEIGIFLGYPLFDVISFMEHKGRNYAFCGYWKAYFNPAGARKRSGQYRKCTYIYKRMFENGTPISRLIVAA